MKIYATNKSPPSSRGKETRPAASRARPAPPRGASISDEVRLTPASGRMRLLEAELADVDIADAGKIEAVRRAITDGEFVVDEEVVAEGLIQESIDTIAHHPLQETPK